MTANLRLCSIVLALLGMAMPGVALADDLPAPVVRNPAAPQAPAAPAAQPASAAPRAPAQPARPATRRAPVRTAPASMPVFRSRPLLRHDNNGPVGPNNRGTSITSAVGPRGPAPTAPVAPRPPVAAPRPAAPSTPVFVPPPAPVSQDPGAPIVAPIPVPPAPPGVAPRAMRAPSSSRASANPGMAFRFSVGDQLEVSVWQEKELTTTHTVLRDGTIPAKAVGNVRVLRRTIEEVHAELTARYAEFLREPRVSIRVLGVHTERAYVLGEVTKPAAIPLNGPVTLLQGIAQAGGFVNGVADLKTIRIVRSRRGQRPRVITVNSMNAIRGRGGMTRLQPGDVVYVHPTGLADWSRRMNTALTPIGTLLGGLGSVATSVVAIDNN